MKWLLLVLLAASCVQTTGGRLVEFQATASGPNDAVAGQPYHFTAATGFEVTLTKAQLFVGAVYLNQTNPANYTTETACILPGIYSGEVKGSLRIDALDPAPQPFPVRGVGTDWPTRAAELWLTAGDVNADDEKTVVLSVEGVATRASDSFVFSANFTIGTNRHLPAGPALPGSNPLCKQRIVSPIAASLTLAQSGTLHLEVNPRRWFDSVDFSALAPDAEDPTRFTFFDGVSSRQPDIALYNALRAHTGPYQFTWSQP